MTIKAHRRKVVIEIKGGLGNQMFQYAAARTLSLELGADLLVESKLGFFLDWEYRRKFELNELPTVFSTSTLVDSYPFYTDRVRTLLNRGVGFKSKQKLPRNFLFEKNFSYINLSNLDRDTERFWMSGYFQDPRYFESHRETVLSELTPPLPSEPNYLELAKLSESFNLIALGIRIFEESSAPGVHARNGINKTLEDFQSVLSSLLDKVLNPKLLVFTTKEFDFLKLMNFPIDTVFVNSERGFHGSVNKLWLLSRCQHHIFNNSTFYWWGATLSQANFRNEEQQIYCSDNFLNPDIVYPQWNKF